jgi:hypothetical protein
MIYVDKPRMREGKLCCHMVADTLQELHDYALSLGLLRRYFQKARKHPHYYLWGFPMEMVLLRLKSQSGVMLVSDKDLVLKSHLLLKNSINHGSNKEGSSKEGQLQNSL